MGALGFKKRHESRQNLEPFNYQRMKINPETNLNPAEIFFMQSNANYTFVHTENKKFLSSRTLKVLTSRIDAENFMKIKRGILINKNFISDFNNNIDEPYVLLKNGKKLPVSRRLYALVCEDLKIVD